MGRQIRRSKEKTMKPNFFVFCEGETEVAYVNFLRSQYRVPIQVISKKSDSNISFDTSTTVKKIKFSALFKRDFIATRKANISG